MAASISLGAARSPMRAPAAQSVGTFLKNMSVEADGSVLYGCQKRARDEIPFSKLKAPLRKAAERTIPALWDALGRLIDLATPIEAGNYAAAAVYDE